MLDDLALDIQQHRVNRTNVFNGKILVSLIEGKVRKQNETKKSN